jgi:hypothetical protein
MILIGMILIGIIVTITMLYYAYMRRKRKRYKMTTMGEANRLSLFFT